MIEACKLARRAIENAVHGQPNMATDPVVQERVRELVREARTTLRAIQALAMPGTEDPLTDPATLARAVKAGVLDAPHLRGNVYARGQIVTRIDGRGACVATDPETGWPLSESARMDRLGIPAKKLPAT